MHPRRSPTRERGGRPLDDRRRARRGAVDDVVVGLEELAQDRRDAGFGLAGQLDLDGGAPRLAGLVDRHDHTVGQVEGAAAETLAELPFADPTEAHRLRLGPHHTDGVAVGAGGQRRLIGAPRETGRMHPVGGQPHRGRGADEERAALHETGVTPRLHPAIHHSGGEAATDLSLRIVAVDRHQYTEKIGAHRVLLAAPGQQTPVPLRQLHIPLAHTTLQNSHGLSDLHDDSVLFRRP